MGQGTARTARAVLSFADAHGAKGRFSVPRARLDITPVEAAYALQELASGGALQIRGRGPAVLPTGALLVTTDRTRIV